jgi:hypothetical protein
MNFTNLYGIKSLSVIDALTHNDYDLQEKPSNVFSCTEICDAPKNKVLQRRYGKIATVDASDNFHSLDGSAVHYALEMSNQKGAARLSEERIFIDVTDISAHTMDSSKKIVEQAWYFANHYYVSFKFDNYEEHDECIEDYKRTSVWEAKNGLKDSRIQQLNINGYGMRLLGFPVNKVRACLFLKDWSSAKLRSEEQSARSKGVRCNYPPIPYSEFEPAVWSDDECLKFISKRVGLHLAASTLNDDSIPPCTPDERWYRGESLAIIKTGNQKATKVFNCDDFETREDAEATAQEALRVYKSEAKKPEDAARYTIEVRPGNDGRCNGEKKYCSICEWCDYWKTNYSENTRGGKEEIF